MLILNLPSLLYRNFTQTEYIDTPGDMVNYIEFFQVRTSSFLSYSFSLIQLISIFPSFHLSISLHLQNSIGYVVVENSTSLQNVNVARLYNLYGDVVEPFMANVEAVVNYIEIDDDDADFSGNNNPLSSSSSSP